MRRHARDSRCVIAHLCAAYTASPVPVIRENVISCLHARVAREPALGVVPLRRLASQSAGLERIGCSVILEHGPSPPSAVREPLAVLHHEVDVMLGTWHRRCGERLQLFRVPMDLRHPRAVRERLAVAGNAVLVGLDHHGISEDRSNKVSVLTDGDNLPGLVSSELGKRQPARRPGSRAVTSCNSHLLPSESLNAA